MRRRVLAAGCAFLVGVPLGVALFLPAVQPRPASSAADGALGQLLVHVVNDGTQDVQVRVHVIDATGSQRMDETARADAGRSTDESLSGLQGGRYVVELGSGSAQGSWRIDTTGCAHDRFFDVDAHLDPSGFTLRRASCSG